MRTRSPTSTEASFRGGALGDFARRRPAVPLAELAAGIRELGELHDAGYLSTEEFADQKRRLLSR